MTKQLRSRTELLDIIYDHVGDDYPVIGAMLELERVAQQTGRDKLRQDIYEILMEYGADRNTFNAVMERLDAE